MCANGYCVEQACAVLNVPSSFMLASQFSLTFIDISDYPDFPVTINVFPDIPVFQAVGIMTNKNKPRLFQVR